ncbi:Nodule Cysteine-Rich (NCR) secreted peptide [Medicago truncatula]|uniref:Nodule Cysteine-Rich (NCR) secreted peptide n=2 Tax=Medicago truncatula TaxID=3880 RepID=A0A072U1J3_MEDTR|nr:Nodule Cysteine-Rich (NCR) secreted peptide [Medicago truncatula]
MCSPPKKPLCYLFASSPFERKIGVCECH